MTLPGRSDPDIRVLDDPAGACAQLLAEAAGRGEQMALTGGSTPRRAYEQAAGLLEDWSSATLWWGDERCVPPDDELSNYRMAKEALLDRLSGPPPTIHRIAAEHGPVAAADDYEHALISSLREDRPQLDLVLLGLGPDAHVASLFPGQETLKVRDRLVVGVERAGHEPYVPRVSMTLPMINAARAVVFLVSGEDKAEAVARAFGADADDSAPASRVRPERGSLTVLLDESAAARL